MPFNPGHRDLHAWLAATACWGAATFQRWTSGGFSVALRPSPWSPLHAFGAQLLQAHMVQHLLLMMVAPPLLWLGTPLLPLLQGLQRYLA